LELGHRTGAYGTVLSREWGENEREIGATNRPGSHVPESGMPLFGKRDILESYKINSNRDLRQKHHKNRPQKAADLGRKNVSFFEYGRDLLELEIFPTPERLFLLCILETALEGNRPFLIQRSKKGLGIHARSDAQNRSTCNPLRPRFER
jgi:hypothetical protein